MQQVLELQRLQEITPSWPNKTAGASKDSKRIVDIQRQYIHCSISIQWVVITTSHKWISMYENDEKLGGKVKEGRTGWGFQQQRRGFHAPRSDKMDRRCSGHLKPTKELHSANLCITRGYRCNYKTENMRKFILQIRPQYFPQQLHDPRPEIFKQYGRHFTHV